MSTQTTKSNKKQKFVTSTYVASSDNFTDIREMVVKAEEMGLADCVTKAKVHSDKVAAFFS